jgi:hypothetical protein
MEFLRYLKIELLKNSLIVEEQMGSTLKKGVIHVHGLKKETLHKSTEKNERAPE